MSRENLSNGKGIEMGITFTLTIKDLTVLKLQIPTTVIFAYNGLPHKVRLRDKVGSL